MNRNPAKQRYAPGTSRGPRSAATLLAQVADLERGERIKALREQRHLTQPVVAARVGVTLRGYQEWEAGGGMRWENAKRLAKTLGVTPDHLMSGSELAATPDLAETFSGDQSQLDRIEGLLQALIAKVGENATSLAALSAAARPPQDVPPEQEAQPDEDQSEAA